MTAELAIDARWMRTGIGRYTKSVLTGLRAHLPDIRTSGIAQSQDRLLVSAFVDRVATCNAGIYGLREQMAVPWLAGKAAALYVPHYNIPIFWRGRLLVTIHDLNHLLTTGYRGTWRSRLYARPMLRRAAERADVVITPSWYTMLQLMDEFGVDRSRIRVIPLCVATCFVQGDKVTSRARVMLRTSVSRPFVLFVGSGAPNKNLPLLLNAMATLHQRRKDAPQLVVAGKKPEDEMLRLVQTLRLNANVQWVQDPADTLLADLYSAALMTVMPSFEEGFGLPVIESMACGTPVLCSRAASLPEVGGDAALYFSPDSSEELRTAMEMLIDSTSTQKQLILAGIARATEFSRQNFHERQAAAIREVLPN
jgi:glycosyltransferase involved in cell wall biosynthesis